MIPKSIQRFIDEQAERSPKDYSDLRAVFLNGTLKRSPGAYLAPALLGAGSAVTAPLGIETMAGALRLTLSDVVLVGSDVRIIASVRRGPGF